MTNEYASTIPSTTTHLLWEAPQKGTHMALCRDLLTPQDLFSQDVAFVTCNKCLNQLPRGE